MTAVEVFKISHEINQRLLEMVNGDAEIRFQRSKDVEELVQKLCVALVEKSEGKQGDYDIGVI